MAVAITVRLSLCLGVLVVSSDSSPILGNDDEGRTLDHVGHAQAGGDALYHRGLSRTEIAIERHYITWSELKGKSAAEFHRLDRALSVENGRISHEDTKSTKPSCLPNLGVSVVYSLLD
jgi:hypothetical protein